MTGDIVVDSVEFQDWPPILSRDKRAESRCGFHTSAPTGALRLASECLSNDGARPVHRVKASVSAVKRETVAQGARHELRRVRNVENAQGVLRTALGFGTSKVEARRAR